MTHPPSSSTLDALLVKTLRTPLAKLMARGYLGLLDGMTRARRALLPTPVAMMEAVMGSYLAQATHVAAELGIADQLQRGALTRDELAKAVKADPDALERLLRLLTQHGIFKLRRDGRYQLNRLGRGLLNADPSSFAAFARYSGAGPSWSAWGELIAAVRTGKPAFEVAHRMPFFDYTRQHPEFGAAFDRSMTAFATAQIPIFCGSMRFPAGAVICDVGGGRGALLAGILKANPGTRGVLFDLPEVVAHAPAHLAEAGVADRVEIRAGSFFETVPQGCDYYVLKNVVHDWGDEPSLQILRAVAAAMTKDGARLVLAELILEPEKRRYPIAALLDVAMLVLTRGGRERTAAEYGRLLRAAGFVMEETVNKLEFLGLLVARRLANEPPQRVTAKSAAG